MKYKNISLDINVVGQYKDNKGALVYNELDFFFKADTNTLCVILPEGIDEASYNSGYKKGREDVLDELEEGLVSLFGDRWGY